MLTLEQLQTKPPRFNAKDKVILEATLRAFFFDEVRRVVGDEKFNSQYIGRWAAPDWAKRWIKQMENDLFNTIGVVVMTEERAAKKDK